MSSMTSQRHQRMQLKSLKRTVYPVVVKPLLRFISPTTFLPHWHVSPVYLRVESAPLNHPIPCPRSSLSPHLLLGFWLPQWQQSCARSSPMCIASVCNSVYLGAGEQKWERQQGRPLSSHSSHNLIYPTLNSSSMASKGVTFLLIDWSPKVERASCYLLCRLSGPHRTGNLPLTTVHAFSYVPSSLYLEILFQ